MSREEDDIGTGEKLEWASESAEEIADGEDA